ncbi:hypothetical protein ACFQHN_10020 [Natrialbaceae archaeon GCM10025896]
MGRVLSKVAKHDDGDDLKALLKSVLAKKKEYSGKNGKTSKLPGTLPMVRRAFPVEERECFENYYVLPAEDAKRVGIDYETEDYILLPRNPDGSKWTIEGALGRPTYFDEGWNDEANDFEFGKAVKPVAEPEPEPETETETETNIHKFTVEEIREQLQQIDDVDDLNLLLTDEKNGKNRKTAVKAIESRISAVSGTEDDTEESEPEPESETETDDAESESVEDAKAELIRALIEKVKNGESLTDAEVSLISSL